MNKKIIILTLGLGLLGFCGMFAFAWFTKPEPPAEPAQIARPDQAAALPAAGEANQSSRAAERIASLSGQSRPGMTDEQLQALIYEVREKIKEYNLKLRDLDVREKRLQSAQDNLKKDIAEMNSLRVELASAVASLKNEQDRLQKRQLMIEEAERENLIAIAAAYDKMDAESAGKILMNMVKTQGPGNSSDDAVKILYYMTERTKAKVLAAMAEAEPAVSAYVSQRLKRTVTKD
jgi:chromosome segregation ATPase